MIRTGETICAPATSAGGAIAVIRISGPRGIEIVDRIFSPSRKSVKLHDQEGYSILHGEIRSGKEIIDDVLVSVFRAPHSYTGEDCIEISCHASPYIIRSTLELLLEHGAVAARPGEFTLRAFLNGKMDLSRAEAVADLVTAQASRAHHVAMKQMKGAVSDEIRSLRSDLLHFASLIELELDFSEEDVEFADRRELRQIVSRVLARTGELVKSFTLGNVIRNGLPVAITGRTNTGKSSLLNLLLNEEKAIVSEIPGTTRDYIEDVIVMEGIEFRFIDTAGLRETGDIIENLGIKRTLEIIDRAAVVLLVADINEGLPVLLDTLALVREIVPSKEKKMIILANKTDMANHERKKEFESSIDLRGNEHFLFISAKTGSGINDLKNMLVNLTGSDQVSSEDVIVANARHREALAEVSASLGRVIRGMEENLPGDLIAIDIRQAIHYLGEITGEITSDEILANIFQNFCIGK